MVSTTDHWYTPNNDRQPVLWLVGRAMGGIDLDPCANEERTVPAQRHYTLTDNGLTQPWHGNAFVNPPFSAPLAWLQKLVQEKQAGNLAQVITLLKIGCLNNQGTGKLIKAHASAICHWHHNGRIKFVPGQPLLEERARKGLPPLGSADFDTVLVYFGGNDGRFGATFREYGMVTWVVRG